MKFLRHVTLSPKAIAKGSIITTGIVTPSAIAGVQGEEIATLTGELNDTKEELDETVKELEEVNLELFQSQEELETVTGQYMWSQKDLIDNAHDHTLEMDKLRGVLEAVTKDRDTLVELNNEYQEKMFLYAIEQWHMDEIMAKQHATEELIDELPQLVSNKLRESITTTDLIIEPAIRAPMEIPALKGEPIVNPGADVENRLAKIEALLEALAKKSL